MYLFVDLSFIHASEFVFFLPEFHEILDVEWDIFDGNLFSNMNRTAAVFLLLHGLRYCELISERSV